MNLNKVFLLGNLTADPEVRTTPSGQTVCNFRIATNRIWIDKNTGEKKQEVQYHRIVAWGKLANTASQYLRKGKMVLVEGRLATRSWQDPSGNTRSRTEIIAQNIQLGPRTASQQQNQIAQKEEEAKNIEEEEIPIIEEDEEINPKEIPF